MVQCEMCGAETASPKTIKVEGAELEVCADCVDFGTEVKQETTESTSTKYSTGSSGGSGETSSGRSTGQSSSSSSGGRSTGGGSDMFDEVDELVQDYDDRIRQAREDRGMSQADLANELNEKASLIRKLERGDTLPSDTVQRELEQFLDISLSGEAAVDDEPEWEGDSATETTLGDVVQRKD